MNSLPVAAIDLGSNTVRLLVGSSESGRIHRLLQRQEATRLSQGLKPGGKLLPEAADRTRGVLERYRRDIEALEVGRTLVCGTMAVRQAVDGAAFMDMVQREIGFETRILTGVQEAGLTAAGVFTGIRPIPDKSLVFDLGGRSTEFVLAVGDRIVEAASFGFGVVGLTEEHIESDPPAAEEIVSVRRAVKDILDIELAGLVRRGSWAEDVSLIGTAGTTTTLAAMAQEMTEYHRELIDNYRLNRSILERMFVRMLSYKKVERAEMPGLPADRADIITAGAAAVLEIMDHIGANSLVVSDAGLLEGIWLAAAGLRSIEDGC